MDMRVSNRKPFNNDVLPASGLGMGYVKMGDERRMAMTLIVEGPDDDGQEMTIEVAYDFPIEEADKIIDALTLLKTRFYESDADIMEAANKLVDQNNK